MELEATADDQKFVTAYLLTLGQHTEIERIYDQSADVVVDSSYVTACPEREASIDIDLSNTTGGGDIINICPYGRWLFAPPFARTYTITLRASSGSPHASTQVAPLRSYPPATVIGPATSRASWHYFYAPPGKNSITIQLATKGNSGVTLFSHDLYRLSDTSRYFDTIAFSSGDGVGRARSVSISILGQQRIGLILSASYGSNSTRPATNGRFSFRMSF